MRGKVDLEVGEKMRGKVDLEVGEKMRGQSRLGSWRKDERPESTWKLPKMRIQRQIDRNGSGAGNSETA